MRRKREQPTKKEPESKVRGQGYLEIAEMGAGVEGEASGNQAQCTLLTKTVSFH